MVRTAVRRYLINGSRAQPGADPAALTEEMSSRGPRGGAGRAPRPQAAQPGPGLALRSAPPASHQTKVDEVLFKFQRLWLGSFAETITLLLGTNVDI